MLSGGFLDTDQYESFDNQTRSENTKTDIKHKSDGSSEDDFNLDPSLIDISELQTATTKVKACFDNATVKDLDNIYSLLWDWVTVLNQTFHKFHIRKYAPFVEKNEISDKSENEFQTLVELDQSKVEQSSNRLDNNKSEEIRNVDDGMQELDMASNNFEKILSDQDFCYIVDPLNLSLELFKQVSQLVQASYEIGCLGDILTYQKLCSKTKELCNNKQLAYGTEEINKQETKNRENTQTAKDCEAKLDANSSNTITEDVKDGKLSTDEGNVVTNELKQLFPANSENSIHEVQNSEDSVDNGLDHGTNTSAFAPISFFIRLYFPYLQLDKLEKENLHYPEWSALVTCLQGKIGLTTLAPHAFTKLFQVLKTLWKKNKL